MIAICGRLAYAFFHPGHALYRATWKAVSFIPVANKHPNNKTNEGKQNPLAQCIYHEHSFRL